MSDPVDTVLGVPRVRRRLRRKTDAHQQLRAPDHGRRARSQSAPLEERPSVRRRVTGKRSDTESKVFVKDIAGRYGRSFHTRSEDFGATVSAMRADALPASGAGDMAATTEARSSFQVVGGAISHHEIDRGSMEVCPQSPPSYGVDQSGPPAAIAGGHIAAPGRPEDWGAVMPPGGTPVSAYHGRYVCHRRAQPTYGEAGSPAGDMSTTSSSEEGGAVMPP